MSSFFVFLHSHATELLGLIVEHMRLTIISVIFAILIGIPLGILISNIKGLDKPVLGFANIMQAVPSLAALGLLVPLIGIGSPPAILMVVLYSLLPILKNTYTGLTNINQDTIEAAFGIGMTRLQVLFRVKLPLALPVIMSGVRIASVTAVGLMTIAAYIGAGGLGNYVISGIQTSNTNLMLCGAIPACILALIMDYVMSKVEKAVVPISLRMSSSFLTKEQISKAKSRRNKTLVAVGIVLAALVLISVSPLLVRKKDTIVVSSKPEVEGLIAGNLIAEVLEEKTDLNIERNMGLGATKIIYSALKTGEIDVYPEYSGSALSGIFDMPPEPGTSAEEIVLKARELLGEEGLLYTGIYGFNNRYTLGVLPEFAEKYNLKTISDLERLSIPLTLACDQEFPHRADGVPALNSVYPKLSFDDYMQFQGALMYEAMMTKKVNVMTPFTTDALLKKYDITVLEDDKSALSNYNMASLIRKDTAEKYPEALEAIKLLEGNISDEEMSEMNYEVVCQGKSPEEVARGYLIKKGII